MNKKFTPHPPFKGGRAPSPASLVNYPRVQCADSHFNLFLPTDGTVSISLFDQTGWLVANKIQNLVAGPQNLKIENLDTYASGIYYYRLESGADHTGGKIIKQYFLHSDNELTIPFRHPNF